MEFLILMGLLLIAMNMPSSPKSYWSMEQKLERIARALELMAKKEKDS